MLYRLLSRLARWVERKRRDELHATAAAAGLGFYPGHQLEDVLEQEAAIARGLRQLSIADIEAQLRAEEGRT